MFDLFGHDTPVDHTVPGKRKPTQPRGYADIPGTGPVGKKCRNCKHYVYRGGTAGTYRKCDLMRTRWTNGTGTDIRAGSPACRRFEEDA